MNDLRQALRRLCRTPGFTFVAALTLALGLSANITVFSMLNEFMLRPLHVEQPEELVFFMQKSPKLELSFGFSYLDYRDIRASATGSRDDGSGASAVFAEPIAYATAPIHLGNPGQSAERTWVHAVSDNYFDLLRVRAARGRLFLAGEARNPGADPIAVLSHRYWLTHFHADPLVLGRTIHLNGAPFTVVGVTPEGFVGAEAMVQANIFVPLTMWDVVQPGNRGGLERRGDTFLMIMSRLQTGATLAQARAAFTLMLARLVADYPDDHAESTGRVVPELMSRPSPYVSDITPLAVGALMVLATLVFAVAVANVANLLYARAADAERTLAIRSSLGATRWRLVRFLLAESMLLALAAAILGWYFSEAFGLALQRITLSSDNPPVVEPSLDWRPIAFTLVAAFVTGLVTGLFPALRATRREMLPLLTDATRSLSRARHPLRSLLVAGQVAISCVVLVCAALAASSLHRLAHVNLGFRPQNVLLATFDLALQRYDGATARRFQTTLLDEVRALPGVTAASLARSAPFDVRSGLRGGIAAEGQPLPEQQDTYLVATHPVDTAWLDTIGMPLLAGREFDSHDTMDTTRVGVVSRALAEHFWPGVDPIGKRLTLQDGRDLVEVVGLVGDARYFLMSDQKRPLLFLPMVQEPTVDFTIAVHTSGDPLAFAADLRAIAHRLDPDLPIQNIRTLEQHIARSPLGLMPLRVGAMIASAQGALVLVLATMGLYGLVSFAVASRTREIGIRIALGATRRDILKLVARPGLVTTTIGLVAGLLLAFAVTRPLAALLYGVSPNDLAVFGGVPALIIVVTIVAAWLPARRATKVNPTEALRAE